MQESETRESSFEEICLGEGEFERALLEVATLRLARINRYSEQFLKYLRLRTWERRGVPIDLDRSFVESKPYFMSSPARALHSSVLPDVIFMNPLWREHVRPLSLKTDADGKERLIILVYDYQTSSLEFIKGPTGTQGSVDMGYELFKISKQIEIDARKPIIALGHTHPLPRSNQKIYLAYNKPVSTAIFSPGDFINVTSAFITPIHFVVSEDHMTLGIANVDTIETDAEVDYYKRCYPGIPENLIRPGTFKDALKTAWLYLTYDFSNPTGNFNLHDWNIEIARRVKLALYHGDYTNLKRIA